MCSLKNIKNNFPALHLSSMLFQNQSSKFINAILLITQVYIPFPLTDLFNLLLIYLLLEIKYGLWHWSNLTLFPPIGNLINDLDIIIGKLLIIHSRNILSLCLHKCLSVFFTKNKSYPLNLVKFGQNNVSSTGDDKFRSLFYIHPWGTK